MEHIRNALDELKTMNVFHELPYGQIDSLLTEMATSKVCTPVIGKFSAGKSALINTLLGYSRPLLKEAITPETAVPAEVVYHPHDEVRVTYADGREETLTIAGYRSLDTDAEQMQVVQVRLKNEQLLAHIADVMVVDMPGFESGFDVHNRAIDEYLPRSQAYILAFPADDMVLKNSMAQMLKELNLHGVPICVVVTKRDKVSEDIMEANLSKLKEDISGILDQADQVIYCVTSSHEGDVEELLAYLLRIQEASQQLLGRKYGQLAVRELDHTAGYLKTVLANSTLSVSDLEEKEDKLKEEMSRLDKDIGGDIAEFAQSIPSMVSEIQADVRSGLQAEESTLVAMIMNKQEITERVNLIIREALTKSLQTRFIPKIRRHMKKLTDRIRLDSLEDMGMQFDHFHLDADGVSSKIVNSVVAGMSLLIFGPLFTIIGAIVSYFIGKRLQERKREEARAEIRQKLNAEVFPNIVGRIGEQVNSELEKQVQAINRSVTDEIARQRAVIEKAMADLKAERTREQMTKEELRAAIERHLNRIEVLQHDL